MSHVLSLLRPASAKLNYKFLHMSFLADKSDTCFKPEGLLENVILMFSVGLLVFRIAISLVCIASFFSFKTSTE